MPVITDESFLNNLQKSAVLSRHEVTTLSVFLLRKLMRNPKYSLTQSQFDVLREKLAKRESGKAFSEENIESAFRIMVQGDSAKNECEARGVSRQSLYKVVRDLWAIFYDLTPPSRAVRAKQYRYELKKPSNWVEVKVVLPPDKAKSVQDLEKIERAKLKNA